MSETKKVAYVFPGQGSQTVKMGKDLWETYDSIKALFKQADEAAGFSLTKLIFEGPEDELRKTINAQPALVTMSIACLRAAQEVAGGKLPAPAFAAGHSLGEYSAMVAANAIDFATAVHLTRERGRLMYEAGLKQPGAMAAVMGMDEAVLNEICRETGTVIANLNSPGQLIISGGAENVAKAAELAKAKGSRVMPLAVSGAFHSPLMQPAVEGMAQVLAKVNFRNPSVPIISNVTSQPLTSASQFRDELLKQLTSGVQWQKSVEYMVAQGTKNYYEIGAGKVLAGLIKRINKEVEVVNLGDVAAIKTLAAV
ncbi:MAG: ACP S-malonyltransferase [Dehalococcoidales bacterium]|nr:ACP S-malonyltransferase [Dehalococcoidales bacterium]